MPSVLIVEDEIALQVFYGRVLEKCGFEVHTASDGEQALAILEELVPDLLMLDMRLPYVNGVQIIEALQDHPYLDRMHVVIATASQEFELYTNYLPSAEFLLKPVLPAQLMALANRLKERLCTCA